MDLCRIALLAFACALSAQTLRFEVASVKPSPKPAMPRRPMNADPARVYYNSITAKQLVEIAYKTADWNIQGGPSWFDADDWDVAATLPAGSTQAQIPAMLQALLADRFHLGLQSASREMSVYELSAAKNGPKLKPGAASDQWNDQGVMNGGIFAGKLILHQCTMGALAQILASRAGRPVLDKTNLNGIFDVTLTWSDKPDSTEPDLYTALQQQLGLKLTPAKDAVGVLLVTHIEKPSAN